MAGRGIHQVKPLGCQWIIFEELADQWDNVITRIFKDIMTAIGIEMHFRPGIELLPDFEEMIIKDKILFSPEQADRQPFKLFQSGSGRTD